MSAAYSTLCVSCFYHQLMTVKCPAEEHSLNTSPSSDGKESACNARDPGSIPGLGRSPGEGNRLRSQQTGTEQFYIAAVLQ